MSKKEELKIVISGDSDKAQKALKDLSDHSDRLGATFSKLGKIAAASFVAAGTAIAAFMVKSVSATSDYASSVDKIVKKTGENAEAVQRLGYAALQEHASMETLEKSLDRLSRNMNDMAQGVGEAQDAFNTLGISVTDADGQLKSSTDVVLEVADRFKDMEDGAEKTALAMELFGKSGAEMVPFLSMGREEIERLGREADELGIVLSGDNIEAFKRYADATDKMKGAFQGIQMEVATAVLPAFAEITDGLTDMFVGLRESGALSEIFTQIGSAISSLLPTIETIFNALAATLEAFGPVIADAFGRLGELFARLVDAVVSSGMLDVLSEIGALLVGTILDVVEALMPAVEAMAPIVTKILEFVASMLRRIGPLLAELASKLADIITRILEKIEPHLDKIFNAAGKIIDAVLPILPALLDMLMPILDILLDLIPPLATLVGWFADLAAMIVGALGSALEWVIGAIGSFAGIWSSVWDAVKSVFSGVWDGIKAIYNTVIAPVVDVLKGIWSGLQSAWESAWSVLKGIVKGAVLGILNVLKPMAYALDVLNVFSGEAVFEGPIIRAIEAVQAWHSGGLFPGYDEYLIPLGKVQGQEFIFQRSAVNSIGVDNLEYMNRTGRIPQEAAAAGGQCEIHFHIPGFFGSQRELDFLARKLVKEHIPRVTFATGGK